MSHSQNSDNRLPLSIEHLIKKVHAKLSKDDRERFSEADVGQVLFNLNLHTSSRQEPTPRLVINRLIFQGEKILKDSQEAHSFKYDQKFQQGVNILLIPDNNVGKSSIMKTIKFALTGDSGGYDADVRSWIKVIWLQFSLGSDNLTIFIRCDAQCRGILAFGEWEKDLDADTFKIPGKVFDVIGSEALQDRLQQFFFDRLGLSSFSWTQRDPSTSSGVAERKASWRTFFQAMVIPDGSDHYLFCDPVHSMGNQDGLILSKFLGLHFVEQMNDLKLNESLMTKQHKNTDLDTVRIQADLEQWMDERKCAEEDVKKIKLEQQRRLEAFKQQKEFIRISKITSQLMTLGEQRGNYEARLSGIKTDTNRMKQKNQNLKRSIAFQQHFTGLDVTLCPNCDTGVEETAIQVEEETCACRLCGKIATLDSSTIYDLNIQISDIEAYIEKLDREREETTSNLKRIEQKVAQLEKEQQNLKHLVAQHHGTSIPTEEEEASLTALYGKIGMIDEQIRINIGRLNVSSTDNNEVSFQIQVISKARSLLQKEAEVMNASVLNRLSFGTQRLTEIIGTESVTDLSCSALGTIKLTKHNTKVTFGSIRNPGERIRVKFAFFLAMMEVGREPGVGRHPGFLLIDQLASSEMVDEDCRAFAGVLKRIDTELCDRVQMICFTAKSEFQGATDASKVYRGQGENGKAF
jgi:hypothetical protein